MTDILVRPASTEVVLRRPASRSPLWTRGLSVLLILVVLLAPAGGLLRQSGQSQLMEEGFMILLPQRVLHGAVAYRDFDWLWGPAGLWVPALVHGLLGWTEAVSRLIGLAYSAFASLAAYALVRRWSEILGLWAGVTVALIDRMSDLPDYAAISFGILALYLAYRSLIGRGLRARRFALLAGLAAGAALLFRPDRGAGAAVALLVVFWGHRMRRNVAAAGFGAGVAAFLGYALWAGLGNTFENVVWTAAQIPGDRYLPIPLSSYATDLWLALVVVALVVDLYAGWRRRRISPGSPRGPVMLGAAVLAVLIVPEFLQRADTGLLLIAGALPLALLPAALADLSLPAEGTLVRPRTALRYGLAVLVVLSVGAWQEAVVPYVRDTGVTLGIVSPGTTTIENDGRSFTYSTPDAGLMAHLVEWVEANTRPGETLFVGPGDLSRTPYNDNSVSVLLPELRDAMSFPDMNPTVALHHQAGLAADVASADVLVLDRQLDQWDEANGSAGRGGQAANLVVRRDFCPAAQFGLYEVLLRCSGSAAGG